MNTNAEHICTYCGLDCAAFTIEVGGKWFCSHFCYRMAAGVLVTQEDREKAAKRTIETVKRAKR